MCSAAAVQLWLSASQAADGGASLSARDAAPGLRRRTPQQRTPEEELPEPESHRRLFMDQWIKQTVAAFLCPHLRVHPQPGRTWRIYYLIPEINPDGGFTLSSWESVGLTGRCRPPAAGHVWRTEETSRPPSRMAGAATRPPYFAVDFDRATGIFWDVPVKLGRGAAFWSVTSPAERWGLASSWNKASHRRIKLLYSARWLL
ncbi:hypothetical protein fugu_015385 [Takifugu bimaculatus]|uniref:Uncharacterized protein n=1 Tax=Takifugu bimaculatus TaxID=433685 RepID=A0A4Z2BYK1_9TELE|nr:hypothetical protein fugu_015385 [Takifugu bimaculatus]